jgi:hypothetical protein
MPGAINHVITKGLNRQDIFLDDCDRNDFLVDLKKNLSLTGCRYCLSTQVIDPLGSHHWSSRHSSGPERIATPCSAEDLSSTSITRSLTSYSMPVLAGAFTTSHIFPSIRIFPEGPENIGQLTCHFTGTKLRLAQASLLIRGD